MSQLKETIRADLKTAMKAREKERTSAIRSLLAAIQAEETNGSRHELTDEDVLKVISREIKKRRESAEVYAENGRQELADAELVEVPFFEAYQPEQLDDAALDALVSEAIAEVEADSGEAVTIKQMGNVMKVATAKAAGRADGKRLSSAVKAKLAWRILGVVAPLVLVSR
ncbi:GatB/YqeY domain-containing protein [Corynebacterium striatum]